MTRRLVWVLAHAFALQLTAYIVRPTSAYRAIELGVAPGLVGLIAASFAVVPLVLAVAIGRWNDRGSQRASLLLGAVLMVAAGVGLLVWSDGLAPLLLWNAVIGLGHLMSVLGEQTLVASEGRGRLESAFGTYTFAGTVGQAAAPALLGLVGGGSVLPDTRVLIWAYTAAAVVLAAVTVPLVLRRPSNAGADSGTHLRLRESLSVPPDTRRTMTGALLLSMLVLASVDLIQVYLPALGVERGISSGVVGALLSLRAIASMVSRVGLSKIVMRMGRRRLVVFSTLMAAAGMAAVALPMPMVALGAVMVVAGLALGVGQPLSMTIVASTAPPGTLSTWLAIRLTGNRLGQAGIPAVLTVVATGAGVGAVFLFTAVGLLGSALLSRALLPE